MKLDYRPGTQFLVARPGLAFLTPEEQLARRVWAAVGTGSQVDELLVELVRDGLRATGAFVLVDTSGERLRVLVRGDLPVRVRSATGTVAWTGAGVSTWAEQVFERVDDVLVGDGEPAADRLPLRDGLVRCAGFLLDGSDRAPAHQASAAVPEAVTVPDAAAPRAAPPDPPPVNEPLPVDPPSAVGEMAPRPEKPMTLPVRLTEPDEPHGPDGPATDPEPSAAPVPVGEFSIGDMPIGEVSIAEVAADPAQTRTEPADDGFDHLFQSTIMRSVEDAAVRDAATPDNNSNDATNIVPLDEYWAGQSPRLGDHDGHTVTAAELGALRQQLPSHRPVEAPPPGARLDVSTGDVVALDRDVVIGRRPEVDRVQGGPVPTVLTVPSPRQDVSRTHLRIGWSGRQVLATDLHSMNGTVLIGADGTARALDGGVPQALAEGDTLDIGDGITLTLRLTSA